MANLCMNVPFSHSVIRLAPGYFSRSSEVREAIASSAAFSGISLFVNSCKIYFPFDRVLHNNMYCILLSGYHKRNLAACLLGLLDGIIRRIPSARLRSRGFIPVSSTGYITSIRKSILFFCISVIFLYNRDFTSLIRMFAICTVRFIFLSIFHQLVDQAMNVLFNFLYITFPALEIQGRHHILIVMSEGTHTALYALQFLNIHVLLFQHFRLCLMSLLLKHFDPYLMDQHQTCQTEY